MSFETELSALFLKYGIIQSQLVQQPAPQFVPFTDIRAFGAKPGFDATDAIIRGFQNEPYLVVPPGVFRLDGNIEMTSGTRLDNFGILRRYQNGNNNPLIHVVGPDVTLSGSGHLISEENVDGIIHVGPRTPTTLANINWVQIMNLTIEGNGGTGVKLTSSEMQVGGSNYNSLYSGLKIKSVDNGFLVGEQCNANSFIGNFFYRIGEYSYNIGPLNSECSFHGGFTHYSKTMKAVILIDRGHYHQFFGVAAEPGGGQAFIVKPGSEYNYFFNHDNTPNGYVDEGFRTTILTHNEMKVVIKEYEDQLKTLLSRIEALEQRG